MLRVNTTSWQLVYPLFLFRSSSKLVGSCDEIFPKVRSLTPDYPKTKELSSILYSSLWKMVLKTAVIYTMMVITIKIVRMPPQIEEWCRFSSR